MVIIIRINYTILLFIKIQNYIEGDLDEEDEQIIFFKSF